MLHTPPRSSAAIHVGLSKLGSINDAKPTFGTPEEARFRPLRTIRGCLQRAPARAKRPPPPKTRPSQSDASRTSLRIPNRVSEPGETEEH